MTWRILDKKAKQRTYALAIITIISVADLIFGIVRNSYPYITNILRPVVVIIFLSQMRQVMLNMAGVLKDTI